ncbi:GNAT family N-acetyltransferase [Paracoccus denitrificans]|jgi:putative acetyltransferase|nr:GNAT family N-acetyltransferase [Paracoccus denitrificans]MBB4626810.1 putative acetyltransferase [Paracoccus denitrificans]MCU7427707.1 GNAT family N-acetyltransferase [Paracoccus denitrificans]QAR24967.1 GNAT family N-acetyltransferase [Paracoccus denitrificans]UPV93854.1 GNAT family N-acetyltransferase [Paracoccus denitrificans]WQO34132.1 GNAT family N-acetyltransferase [Paracoccus denitrificans]
MCITVNIEDPKTPDVRDLLGAGIDFMQSLYPGKRKDGLSAAPPDVSDSPLFVARSREAALGCCALVLHRGFAEIKRMYVVPSARGRGIASHLLQALESVAKEEGNLLLKLETGTRLTDAHRLYARHGFVRCGVFGGHSALPESLFMEKHLTQA